MQVNLSGLVISVTFLLVYIAAPLGSLILGVYQIFSKKKSIIDMGEYISNIKPLSIKPPNKVLLGFMLFLSIVFFFTISKIVATIYAISIFQIFTGIYSSKKYQDVNGVYENGFILGREAYKWGKIHSYKVINITNLSILKTDGMRTDIDEVQNIGEVLDIFTKNNIKPES